MGVIRRGWVHDDVTLKNQNNEQLEHRTTTRTQNYDQNTELRPGTQDYDWNTGLRLEHRTTIRTQDYDLAALGRGVRIKAGALEEVLYRLLLLSLRGQTVAQVLLIIITQSLLMKALAAFICLLGLDS